MTSLHTIIDNASAPTLLRDDYYCIPSLEVLAKLSDMELQKVEHFIVGRKDVGEVRFLYPVNLRHANLDELITIKKGKINIYPPGTLKPKECIGLNVPALFVFKGIFPKTGLQDAVEQLKLKLRNECIRMGSVFVDYDANSGIWIVKV